MKIPSECPICDIPLTDVDKYTKTCFKYTNTHYEVRYDRWLSYRADHASMYIVENFWMDDFFGAVRRGFSRYNGTYIAYKGQDDIIISYDDIYLEYPEIVKAVEKYKKLRAFQ